MTPEDWQDPNCSFHIEEGFYHLHMFRNSVKLLLGIKKSSILYIALL